MLMLLGYDWMISIKRKVLKIFSIFFSKNKSMKATKAAVKLALNVPLSTTGRVCLFCAKELPAVTHRSKY